MSGLVQEQAAAEAAHKAATVEYGAAVSSPHATQAERAVKEQAAADAAARVVDLKARVAASNVTMRPVTPANVGGVLADVHDPEVRAGAVYLSQAANVDDQLMRAAWDELGRLKQRAARGGDVQAEALRVIHGALGKDAPAALAAAKALVNRDPKLRDFLADTGLGNSAWMVRHLAAEARKRGIAR